MSASHVPRFAAAALLVALLASCAPKPLPPTIVPPRGAGQLSGKVFLEGNRPLPAPVTVSVGGVTTKSDASGAYAVKGLPAGKMAVVAELKVKETRYLALPFVFVDERQGVQLDLELKDAGDVDRFCMECHPDLGKQTNSRQIVRDAHPSGVRPKKAARTGELLDARGMVTCESCHSLHQATGVERFVRYPFMTGDLCNRCH